MTLLRIAIACSSLCVSRGGSERAATALAAEMARRGHQPLLLSAFWPGQDARAEPVYGLPAGVRHHSIDAQGKHAHLRELRALLLDWGADVLLSMQSDADHLLWAMACMGSGIPLVCSERCDPVAFVEGIAWNRAGRHALLSGADCIHELLPTYVDSVPPPFREKVRVIPNAAPAVARAADPVGGQRKNLLFLARLCAQKQPLLLLEAFSRVMDRHPDWDLTFWGHGPQTRMVRRRATREGLAGRVHFKGICTDSAAAFAAAQLYCLPSAYEGFPNTVLEAMSAGLPVVGLAACPGVRGVVRDGVTGLLAQEHSAAGLARVLDQLMGNPEARAAMGEAARAACADYAAKTVFDQWEALFVEMAQRKGHTVMDSFYQQPFASRATLSAAARREWLFRNFGETMPYSMAWWRERAATLLRNLGRRATAALRPAKRSGS